jgi:uncharacterized protein (DUF362 family)/Pyruvate/2-oxoacid:ferredoxin oxidoreductase delta subunit
MFPLDIRGKKVAIKPNVLRSSKAEEHIVTHAPFLQAVVEKVESLAPAEIIVGDNPGLINYGDNERSFIDTGLMEAAKGYFKNIGNEIRHLPFRSDLMPQVGVSADIMDADILISVPKFKTHGLTVISGAIKNSYGILPGAQKAKLHRLAGSPACFHEVIVDVFKLRIPDFIIMDAITGMEGNGPASPDLRDVGLIIASDNAVALDATVSRIMGLDPGKLPFLVKAKNDGLGSFDSKEIQIEGTMPVIRDYKLPPLGGEAIINNEGIQEMICSICAVTPTADLELCTSCGACIAHCPVSALSMENDLPVPDMKLCVTCFCCQEICPEKAMVLR